MPDNQSKRLFLILSGILIFSSLFLRLFYAYKTPGASADIGAYKIQAQAVKEGKNIYEETTRYPYPPVWMYVPFISTLLSEKLDLPFEFVVKFLPVLFDLFVLTAVWLLFSWSYTCSSLLWGALLLFNPASFLIVVGGGQFDSIPIFLVLLAWVLLERFSFKYKEAFSALLLGIAIVIKVFPIFLVPLFVWKLKGSKAQKLIYLFLSVAPFLTVSVQPVISSFGRYMEAVFLRQVPMDASLSYLLGGGGLPKSVQGGLLGPYRFLSKPMLVALAVLIPATFERKNFYVLTTIIWLATYSVSYGLAVNHLYWVIPFLFISSKWGFVIYSISSTAALISFYLKLFPGALYPLFIFQEKFSFLTTSPARWWANFFLLLTCVGLLIYLLFKRVEMRVSPEKEL